MASHRIARSLDQMRAQVNQHAPGRNKSADGWIGDAKHAASTSDHNPWVKDGSTGIVTALDVTHDPANGVDTWKMADHLRSKRDARIKYVISNGRIFSSTTSPWVWRNYSGSNPHRTHIHVSVNSGKTHYDDTRPWDLGLAPGTPAPPVPDDRPASRPVLRRGSKGADVRHVQSILLTVVDGDFGPETERATKDFQAKNKLVVDGIIGPKTWEVLDKIEQVILPYQSEPHLFSDPALKVLAVLAMLALGLVAKSQPVLQPGEQVINPGTYQMLDPGLYSKTIPHPTPTPEPPPILPGPTPNPDNTIVNVAPGTDTITAAVAANPNGHTTYQLSAGIYLNGEIGLKSFDQVLGAGKDVTIVKHSGTSGINRVFAGRPNRWSRAEYVEIANLTADANCPTQANNGYGQCVMLQGSHNQVVNCHMIGWGTRRTGAECFPIFMVLEGGFSPGADGSHNRVINCDFDRPAPAPHATGCTVVIMGHNGPRTTGSDNAIIGCTFNSDGWNPSNTGGIYYQCVGSNLIENCIAIGQGKTLESFWYTEGTESQEPTTLRHNVVINCRLAFYCHVLGANNIGDLTIEDNTCWFPNADNQSFFVLHNGEPLAAPLIRSVTLKHNVLVGAAGAAGKYYLVDILDQQLPQGACPVLTVTGNQLDSSSGRPIRVRQGLVNNMVIVGNKFSTGAEVPLN